MRGEQHSLPNGKLKTIVPNGKLKKKTQTALFVMTEGGASGP